MSTETRPMLPAYLLLAAAGVAVGATVAGYADQGTIAWSRLISAMLLIVLAAGYGQYARRGPD